MRAIGRTGASYRAYECELSGVQVRAIGRTRLRGLTRLGSQFHACLMADHLTQLQRTNLNGFPKPGELIEITGAHETGGA